MRFMILLKATQDTEAGMMPSEALLTAMGKFNAELVQAGVMVDGGGLHPSARATRVRFSGADRTVVNGPFPTPGLITGYWIWEVKSQAEAIEWLERCPNPTGDEGEIEIRQLFSADDFGAEFTPELRAQEEQLRAQMAHENIPRV